MARRADSVTTVPTIVRILCAYHDMAAADVAEAIGLSRATFSYRMVGKTSFTYDELLAMADVFEVDPAVWFDSPAKTLSYLRTGSGQTQPAVAVLPAAGDADQAARVA